jgi:hypothetical protein
VAPAGVVDDHLDHVVGEVPVPDAADRVRSADDPFRRRRLGDALGVQ